MNNKAFEDLCASVRQSWTQQDGVVLKLKTFSKGRKTYRLCAGSYSNDGFAARKVILWDNEKMLYNGSLQSMELRSILSRKGVCFCEITTVRLLNKQEKGVFKCFKCPSTCKKNCRLKTASVVQVSPGVSVSIA